jgi:hypothetical protein
MRDLWEGRHPKAASLRTLAAFHAAGTQEAVRLLWRAHGFDGAPCRHCWHTEGAHAEAVVCMDGWEVLPTSYAPAEGW